MPQPKKPARPRIDAIIRHIKSGSFDAEIALIKEAIDERNKQRQEAVLATVKEVFGQSATVVNRPGVPGQTPGVRPSGRTADSARRMRPGAEKPAPAPEPPQEDIAPVEGETPETFTPEELQAAEQAALAREAALESELASSPASADPEDDEAGIVSNSPIIGSVEGS